jgi:hypothetical protein
VVSLTALAAMTEGVRTTVLSHGRGGGDEADGGMVYGSDIFTETAPSEIVIAPSEIAHESEEPLHPRSRPPYQRATLITCMLTHTSCAKALQR